MFKINNMPTNYCDWRAVEEHDAAAFYMQNSHFAFAEQLK